MTHIIAHRGNSRHAPENTLEAFRQARSAGADGVELDVRLSSDGIPVVIHDGRLERTTDGKGDVGAHSAAELTALNAGSWFGPSFRGEFLPSLAQALELLAPTAMEVHLELKTEPNARPGLPGKVVAEVERAGLGRRAVLSSFQHDTLAEAKSIAPWVSCAALLHAPVAEPWRLAARLGLEGIHPHHPWVTADLVGACGEAGISIRPYTVDDPERALSLMKWGVDGIIGNDPRRLVELRNQHGIGR